MVPQRLYPIISLAAVLRPYGPTVLRSNCSTVGCALPIPRCAAACFVWRLFPRSCGASHGAPATLRCPELRKKRRGRRRSRRQTPDYFWPKIRRWHLKVDAKCNNTRRQNSVPFDELSLQMVL